MIIYGNRRRRRANEYYGGYSNGPQPFDLLSGINTLLGLVNLNPNYFNFYGNCQSLQARLTNMSDHEINQIIDANISITGIEIKHFNMECFTCTIFGEVVSFFLFVSCAAIGGKNVRFLYMTSQSRFIKA